MTKTKSKKQIGNLGEKIAEVYLLEKGYEIIDRNYFSQYGEIDLIAKISDQLIFVEVKTRTNENFGNPEDAVHKKKLERMISTAHCYFEEHDLPECVWRLDLISIKIFKDGNHEIIHFEDINE